MQNHSKFANTISVMATRINGRWQNGIRCELPDLQSGEDFVVKIAMFGSFYMVFFNDLSLSKTFPYHDKLSLAKYLYLRGGDNGFTWNKIVMPGKHKFGKTKFLDLRLKRKAQKEKKL